MLLVGMAVRYVRPYFSRAHGAVSVAPNVSVQFTGGTGAVLRNVAPVATHGGTYAGNTFLWVVFLVGDKDPRAQVRSAF